MHFIVGTLSFAAVGAPTTHFDEPGFYPGREYVHQNFAEHIDPFNGNLELHYADVFLPGNGGFDLKVQRSYNSIRASDAFSPFGRGWDIHFGRVKHDAAATCSSAAAQSLEVELADGSPQILYKSDAGLAGTVATDYVTTQLWKGQCAASGMTLFAPNGTRYDMTELDNSYWHVKTITDRNGNRADFTYQIASITVGGITSTRKVVSNITTSDGRIVNLNYVGGRLSTITAHGRTWSYGISSNSDGSPKLDRVTPPAGQPWLYAYFGSQAPSAGGYAVQRLTYPQGGSVTYAYNFVNFLPGVTPSQQWTVVTSKTTADGTWSFSYQPGSVSFDTTTVTLPGSLGTITYEHFGHAIVLAEKMWKVGLLNKKTIGMGGQTAQTETYDWGSQVISNEDLVRPGYKAIDTRINRPLMASKTVARDSGSFSTTFYNFDVYGFPQAIDESGTKSRRTTKTYYSNVASWILGFTQDENVGVGDWVTTRTYSADGNGNLADETIDGVKTTFTYLTDGSVFDSRNARNFSTTYSLYKRGVPQSESRPETVSVTRVVDDFGNVNSETDGQFTWGYGYDGLNRITRVDPPAGNTVNVVWGATSKSLSRGSFMENVNFDSYGRASTTTRSLVTGTYKQFEYDALGRKTFESLPASVAGITTTYDALGRPKTVTSPGPFPARSYAYQAASTIITNERGLATTYQFDRYGDPEQGSLVAIVTPGFAADVSMTRDSVGRLRSATQGGVTRTYGYTNGFVSSVTEPETGVTNLPPDAVGNLQSRTVGGVTTTFTYDGLNRMDSAIYGGTATATFGYDKRGNILQVTNSASTRDYTYDGNGNLKTDTLSIDGRTFGVVYAYDLNDKLYSIDYPLAKGMVSYGPDALGRARQAMPYLNIVDYWDSGNTRSLTFANNVTMNYEEDVRQLPTRISSPQAQVQLNLLYDYDGVGNVMSIQNAFFSNENRTLGYDGVDRLASASGPWGPSSSFTYSTAGNLKRQQLGSYAIDYTYDASNKLASISGSRSVGFSYDSRGNVASKGATSFVFDNASRLNCANCGTANEVRYRYDGQGRRVTEEKGGQTTYFVQAPNGDLQFEYSPYGLRWTKNAYLYGKRIASEAGSDAAASSVTLSSSASSIPYAQPVTITATVAPAGATGTVEFIEGSRSLGVVTLVNGQAAVTVSDLP